jgi:hypothetical protein
MKTLFALATVIVVLFLTIPIEIGAQKRKAARIIEGTISGYECGDNCYLTIIDKTGKQHIGLCTAHPLCTKWNREVMMPDSYKGKRVRVTVGKGTQLTGSGDVVGTMDAFTRIQLLTAPSSSVSTKPQLSFYIRLFRCHACSLSRREQQDVMAVFRANGLSAFYGSEKYNKSYDKIESLKKLPGVQPFPFSLFVGPFQSQSEAQSVVSQIPTILRKQISEDERENLKQSRAGFAIRLSPEEVTGFYEVSVVTVLSP